MHTSAAAVVASLTGALLVLPTFGASQGRRVAEREPNNSLSTATSASLGDTLVGTYEPQCDKDFYVLDIPAGSRINFQGGPAYINVWRNADSVVAAQIGDRPPPRDVTITVSGRYFISVSYPFHEDPSDCSRPMVNDGYKTRVIGTSDPLGPADPPLPAFEHLEEPVARVTAGANELWGRTQRGAVARINADGSTDVVIGELSGVENSGPYGAPYVLDGFGNLLIPGTVRAADAQDSSIIWRVNPQTGATTVLTSGRYYQSRLRLAVAPNGDVWLGPAWRNNGSGQRTYVWRYDPLGSLLDSVEVSPRRPESFQSSTVSAAGDLYLSGYEGVHRIANGAVVLVIPRDSEAIKSIAFDRDGYLYAVKGETNADHRVAFYDPSFHLLDDTLAHLPFGAFEYQLFFASDRAGHPRGRLLALSFYREGQTQFAELSPAGIRAPGFSFATLLPIDRPSDSSAVIGLPFAVSLHIPGAPGAVHWSIANGMLPPGVTLSETTGELSGVPHHAGSYTFSVRAQSGDRFGFARFTITVADLSFSIEDAINALLGGPALTPANAQFLDQHGNQNGILDAGDVRALLRARALLPSPPTRAQP
jgi:hypothetical protein